MMLCVLVLKYSWKMSSPNVSAAKYKRTSFSRQKVMIRLDFPVVYKVWSYYTNLVWLVSCGSVDGMGRDLLLGDQLFWQR